MARDASGAAIAFVTGDAVPPEIDIATVVAALATSLTVAYGWPQIRRLRRTGDVTGVSISTTALSVASEVGWLIYLTGERLWSALPEAMLTMVVNLVLTVVLLRAGSEWAVGVAAAGAWGIVLIGGRVVGGPAAIAVLLSVTYAVQLAPAVWTAWRAWCPSGVSAGAWTVRFTQSALWSGYGFMRDDPPLVTLGMIGSVASAAVLARLVVTRARPSVAGLTIAMCGSQRVDRAVMSTLKRLLSVLALAAIATFVSPSASNADASPIAPPPDRRRSAPPIQRPPHYWVQWTPRPELGSLRTCWRWLRWSREPESTSW